MGETPRRLSFGFSYSERLHLDKEFEQAMKKGRRISNPAILIYGLDRKDSRPLRRLGLVTSRKVGTAVERNHAKRSLREIFRLNKHGMKESIDLVFVLRKPCVALNYQKLEKLVLGMLEKEGLYKNAEISGN